MNNQKQQQPTGKPTDTVTMTPAQIQEIAEAAVNKARRAWQAEERAAPRLRNVDLQAQAQGPDRQTQEDVALTAMTVGPVSHPKGHYARPPEAVSARDFSENSALIGKVTALGYVVTLNGVEFDARYEPTKKVVSDGRQVDVALDPAKHPPPPEAAELVAQLRETDPIYSRVWITKWLGGKVVSGERQLDNLTAEDQYAAKVKALQSVEAGDLSGLDNLGGMEVGAPVAVE